MPTGPVDAPPPPAEEVAGMTEAVDVVVIGLGPGGEHLAGELAAAGLEVVAVEKELVGGECPYWACVPSKMMLRAAGLLAEGRRIPGMAGRVSVEPDYAPVAERIRREATDDWNDQVAVDRLAGKGARVVRGAGRFSGPGEVTVGEQVFTARRGVVVATGSVPVIPRLAGLAGTPYWTNRDAIKAMSPPGSLLVLGGGAVGLELAQVFARFGSSVTVVETADRVLPAEEPEAGRLLGETLPRDGIELRTGARPAGVSHAGDRFSLRLDVGDGAAAGPAELHAERLLVATGRRADLTPLGLDAAGVRPGGRWLEVDDRMRVRDGLWAIGDVTGTGLFTHTAMYQATVALRDILDRPGPGADYRALPRVTFTDPEVGGVGLTERQAAEAGVDVATACVSVPESARGWIHKAGNDGFIKLVADRRRGVLVGGTSAGPCGGEVLSAVAVAVQGEVPIPRLREMILAYPTFHRAIGDALAGLG
jgi:pyruvate/2-oxoglutarate dehydrogenase complex dihydrolipoamide dehydrogenase (E3) component